MTDPASLWYMHPGFLAGSVMGILIFAIGVAYGFAIGRSHDRRHR